MRLLENNNKYANSDKIMNIPVDIESKFIYIKNTKTDKKNNGLMYVNK